MMWKPDRSDERTYCYIAAADFESAQNIQPIYVETYNLSRFNHRLPP
jgi:hypothetical protein